MSCSYELQGSLVFCQVSEMHLLRVKTRRVQIVMLAFEGNILIVAERVTSCCHVHCTENSSGSLCPLPHAKVKELEQAESNSQGTSLGHEHLMHWAVVESRIV